MYSYCSKCSYLHLTCRLKVCDSCGDLFCKNCDPHIDHILCCDPLLDHTYCSMEHTVIFNFCSMVCLVDFK